ncbi:MAG: S16 family serine protease [Halobacteriota archaeon]|nr:S16 family serine protease [Halobacteriota archaeon]
MQRRSWLIIILALLLVVMTVASVGLFMVVSYQESMINELHSRISEQEILISKLKYVRNEEVNFNCTNEAAVPLDGEERIKRGKIVAVSGTDNTGTLGEVSVEIISGQGRVLINTNPFIEADTQHSAKIAVEVAQNFTGKSLLQNDVIITFDLNDTIMLGGPSAGAIMTTVVIAAIEDKDLRDDVLVTGTIEPSGWVGSVDGVLEKAQAATEDGASTLLVPHGGSLVRFNEKVIEEERFLFFTIERVRYEPKIVDLNEYLNESDMEVVEVFTIDEVVDYMLV